MLSNLHFNYLNFSLLIDFLVIFFFLHIISYGDDDFSETIYLSVQIKTDLGGAKIYARNTLYIRFFKKLLLCIYKNLKFTKYKIRGLLNICGVKILKFTS